MADSYKVLAAIQLGSAVANVYAPAVSTQAIIKSIVIMNMGANTETVTLYVNGTTGPFQWGVARVLAPLGSDGSSAEWDGTLALKNADFLAGKATDGTAVNCIISGDEVT